MCSPQPPSTPDYAGAAKEQGAANLKAGRQQAYLNNPNIYTPYGSQTVEWGVGDPTLDSDAYDEAVKNYNAQLSEYNKTSGPGGSWQADRFGDDVNRQVWVPGSGTPAGIAPVAPKKEDFMRPDPNRAQITQKLSPEQQAIFDQTTKLKGLLGGLGVHGAESLQGVVGQKFDLSGAPQAGRLDLSGLPEAGRFDISGAPETGDYESTRNKVIQAMMGRADEDFGRQREQTTSELVAAGIRPGTKAFEDRMFAIDKARNDARQQAELLGGNAAAQAYGIDASRRGQYVGEKGQEFASQNLLRGQALGERGQQFSADNDARRQYIAELLTQRQTPLNEIIALMGGSQVQNPFAGGGNYQGTNVAPAPIFGAFGQQGAYDTDVYNQEVASNNSNKQAAAQMMAAWLMSDVRLKSNIVKIADHPSGFGIYEYDIFGNREIGVLAQEVMTVIPDAVMRRADGYLMVNYGGL